MNAYEDYKFEEQDDSRTQMPNYLIPDYAVRAEEEVGPLVPGKVSSDRSPETDEFWVRYERLLDACGQVAYYWRMAQNVGKQPYNQAKNIAVKYNHDLAYYREQRRAWTFEARRALKLWQFYAYRLGVEFHFADDGDDFLNSLIDSDRRDCSRDTVRYAKPKGLLLHPDEIEDRYKKRLERRREKRSKLKRGSSS